MTVTLKLQNKVNQLLLLCKKGLFDRRKTAAKKHYTLSPVQEQP